MVSKQSYLKNNKEKKIVKQKLFSWRSVIVCFAI